MTTVSDVVAALSVAFRKVIPSLKKVYLERIDHIETPAISIEVVSSATEQLDAYGVKKLLTLDIAYFSADNKVAEALETEDIILSVLLPGFWVGARHLKPLNAPVCVMVEQDLHVGVSISWFDEWQADKLYSDIYMEDLDLGIKKG